MKFQCQNEQQSQQQVFLSTPSEHTLETKTERELYPYQLQIKNDNNLYTQNQNQNQTSLVIVFVIISFLLGFSAIYALMKSIIDSETLISFIIAIPCGALFKDNECCYNSIFKRFKMIGSLLFLSIMLSSFGNDYSDNLWLIRILVNLLAMSIFFGFGYGLKSCLIVSEERLNQVGKFCGRKKAFEIDLEANERLEFTDMGGYIQDKLSISIESSLDSRYKQTQEYKNGYGYGYGYGSIDIR